MNLPTTRGLERVFPVQPHEPQGAGPKGAVLGVLIHGNGEIMCVSHLLYLGRVQAQERPAKTSSFFTLGCLETLLTSEKKTPKIWGESDFQSYIQCSLFNKVTKNRHGGSIESRLARLRQLKAAQRTKERCR